MLRCITILLNLSDYKRTVNNRELSVKQSLCKIDMPYNKDKNAFIQTPPLLLLL
jgi:hypothetical protein